MKYSIILFLLIINIFISCDKKSEQLFLTQEENEWLNKNIADIVFTPDPSFMPFEAIDAKGNFIGIGADFLEKIENLLSVKFKIKNSGNWSSVLQNIKNNESAGVLAITMTPERMKYLNFTEPYINVPVVFLARNPLTIF